MIEGTGDKVPMLIRLNDVTRTYKVGVEDIHALKEINLEIEDNEYVAIMGPSGSGKSTLMNLLGCLDRATSGTYELAGEDTTQLETSELARIRNRQIGFVFQSFELLPRQSALKNVELPLVYSDKIAYWERRKLAMAALNRVGLGERYKHHPNQLSGGQKQRVAIARALVCNPSILLADEPTGNLDSQTGDDIMAEFDRLHAEGQTIVMVTHEEYIANHARRVIRMRDGRIDTDERQDTGVGS
ncbi:MAG: ABC transporter ATP-binding protein [Desulfobacterales bacterium]